MKTLAQIRKSLDKPHRLEAAQFLQHEIAKRLFDKLAPIKLQPKTILDAGCGEAKDNALFKQHYRRSLVFFLDCVSTHLHKIKNKIHWIKLLIPFKKNKIFSICGDFSELPLVGNSIDLLWSNLALHWHTDYNKVFQEWKRVLANNGVLIFSCFGPDSFKELRNAAEKMDNQVPQSLNKTPFVDMHEVGDLLMRVGLNNPVMDMEVLTLTYHNVNGLLRDAYALGGGLTKTRPGLISRQRWQKFLDNLEAQRKPDGLFHLTIEIVYGHAFKVLHEESATEKIITFHPRANAK